MGQTPVPLEAPRGAWERGGCGLRQTPSPTEQPGTLSKAVWVSESLRLVVPTPGGRAGAEPSTESLVSCLLQMSLWIPVGKSPVPPFASCMTLDNLLGLSESWLSDLKNRGKMIVPVPHRNVARTELCAYTHTHTHTHRKDLQMLEVINLHFLIKT